MLVAYFSMLIKYDTCDLDARKKKLRMQRMWVCERNAYNERHVLPEMRVFFGRPEWNLVRQYWDTIVNGYDDLISLTNKVLVSGTEGSVKSLPWTTNSEFHSRSKYLPSCDTQSTSHFMVYPSISKQSSASIVFSALETYINGVSRKFAFYVASVTLRMAAQI